MRPEKDVNEEFPFEIKYTDFVSQCFCPPCSIGFHVISDITEPGSRGKGRLAEALLMGAFSGLVGVA